MDKKLLKQLIQASYTNDQLEEEKVEKIANLLRRKELKAYIHGLKKAEAQKSIIVETPTGEIIIDQGELKETFPNKKIVYKTNPSLIAGIRIINDDRIYEANIKNSLQNIFNHVEDIYD